MGEGLFCLLPAVPFPWRKGSISTRGSAWARRMLLEQSRRAESRCLALQVKPHSRSGIVRQSGSPWLGSVLLGFLVGVEVHYDPSRRVIDRIGEIGRLACEPLLAAAGLGGLHADLNFIQDGFGFLLPEVEQLALLDWMNSSHASHSPTIASIRVAGVGIVTSQGFPALSIVPVISLMSLSTTSTDSFIFVEALSRSTNELISTKGKWACHVQ